MPKRKQLVLPHKIADADGEKNPESTAFSIPELVYQSISMNKVVESVYKACQSSATVLITGETGTGKEIIAHAIHRSSKRSHKPFIPINCTMLQPALVESELFGHRKGAYTGALENAQGVIRTAEGGTLFLDEIGDAHLELQPKLLRFLQEKEIHPLGDPTPRKVDVRVIAATNQSLKELVRTGRFRKDLYYRLQILEIYLPPLRERKEDIPFLIEHFLRLHCRAEDKENITFSEEVLQTLYDYEWPGNVRELSNEILRLVVKSESNRQLQKEDLSDKFYPATLPSVLGIYLQAPPAQPNQKGVLSLDLPLKQIKYLFERDLIAEALRRNKWNLTRAAAEINVTRPTLREKIKKFGLNRSLNNQK